MMSHRERGLLYVAISGVALAVLIELAMGRTAFCRCGSIRLWSGDPWGPENSQQLTDAYTFTHITHGVLVYGLLQLLGRRLSLGARGVLAVAIESSWEVLENTDWIIGPGREGPTLESIFSQPVRRGTIYLVGWLASLSGSWLDGSSGVRTIRAPTSLWCRAPGTCWLGTRIDGMNPLLATLLCGILGSVAGIGIPGKFWNRSFGLRSSARGSGLDLFYDHARRPGWFHTGGESGSLASAPRRVALRLAASSLVAVAPAVASTALSGRIVRGPRNRALSPSVPFTLQTSPSPAREFATRCFRIRVGGSSGYLFAGVACG